MTTLVGNNAIKDHTNTNTAVSSPMWHLRQMDEILDRFSDTASCTRQGANDLWQRHHNEERNKTGEVTLKEVSERYAPVTLGRQFELVYSMLHPGLVARKSQQNVSVFLEGRM